MLCAPPPASLTSTSPVVPRMPSVAAGVVIFMSPVLATAEATKATVPLVTSNSADASLTDLRGFVLSLGGSVYYNYKSLRMVAVMMPASRVMDLAGRADVVSVSPNRAVARTSSQLQSTTGAANEVRIDLGEGRAAIDLRLARAEQVEVRAMQDQQLRHRACRGTPRTRSLAQALRGVQTITSRSRKFSGLMQRLELRL